MINSLQWSITQKKITDHGVKDFYKISNSFHKTLNIIKPLIMNKCLCEALIHC